MSALAQLYENMTEISLYSTVSSIPYVSFIHENWRGTDAESELYFCYSIDHLIVMDSEIAQNTTL